MGRLVAQGVLEHMDGLDALCRAAEPSLSPDASRSGLRSRLSATLMDSTEAWRRARHWADRSIRRGIRPMIEERATAIEIVRHAHALNESEGEPMLRREVVEIVGEELQAALRTIRPMRGRRRVS
jgi:hypothetical protein